MVSIPGLQLSGLPRQLRPGGGVYRHVRPYDYSWAPARRAGRAGGIAAGTGDVGSGVTTRPPSRRRADGLERPHPSRFAPDAARGDVGYEAAMAAHAAAVAAGEAGYLDPRSGLFVLTAPYLAGRGWCCENGCRHCPFVGADGPEPADGAEPAERAEPADGAEPDDGCEPDAQSQGSSWR